MTERQGWIEQPSNVGWDTQIGMAKPAESHNKAPDFRTELFCTKKTLNIHLLIDFTITTWYPFPLSLCFRSADKADKKLLSHTNTLTEINDFFLHRKRTDSLVWLKGHTRPHLNSRGRHFSLQTGKSIWFPHNTNSIPPYWHGPHFTHST